MVRLAVLAATAAVFSFGAAQMASAAGDVTAGEKIFKRCSVCHGIGDSKKPIGPSLNNVIGRTAGTLEGFKYSEAMKKAGADGLVWSEAEVADYVMDPKKKIPGNKMVFPGLKDEQQRADVAAYVASFTK